MKSVELSKKKKKTCADQKNQIWHYHPPSSSVIREFVENIHLLLDQGLKFKKKSIYIQTY